MIRSRNQFQTPIKTLRRSSTLPSYTALLLSNPKSKYKSKKLLRFNSIQKINESSETSNLTRINSINRSNKQLVSATMNKPKGRVTFAPNFRLIKYIDFNPNESILKNNFNFRETEEIKEINERKEEDKVVCLQCTCIIF